MIKIIITGMFLLSFSCVAEECWKATGKESRMGVPPIVSEKIIQNSAKRTAIKAAKAECRSEGGLPRGNGSAIITNGNLFKYCTTNANNYYHCVAEAQIRCCRVN